MLALDLAVFHRKAHAVSLREAFAWSIVWISLALIFNLGIYYVWGEEKALEFLTGYLIEKSLSVDNLFVFLVIFSYFAVPAMYQHRVLFWGILGALVMRAIFIATGAALLTAFHWMIYVFGGFLIITGIKLLLTGDHKLEPEKNPAVRLLRRVMHVTKEYDGQRFFVRVDGRLQLLEGPRFPKEFDQKLVPVFNTNTALFDLDALDRDYDLTWMYVEKDAGGRPAVQVERVYHEASAFLPTTYLEVPRRGVRGRFFPIKTPDDLERAQDDLRDLLAASSI